jgi:hypothetical protein
VQGGLGGGPDEQVVVPDEQVAVPDEQVAEPQPDGQVSVGVFEKVVKGR